MSERGAKDNGGELPEGYKVVITNTSSGKKELILTPAEFWVWEKIQQDRSCTFEDLNALLITEIKSYGVRLGTKSEKRGRNQYPLATVLRGIIKKSGVNKDRSRDSELLGYVSGIV